MRIGIFTNSYLPIVSGVVNAIECIRRSLTERGHQVYIIGPHYSGYQDQNDFVLRYPSFRLFKDVDFPIAVPFAPKISAKLKKLRLDIIHAQHPFLLGVTGAKLAKAQKIPLVFTYHTRYEQYVHYVPIKISQQWISRFVENAVASYLKQCDAIIVPSASILDVVKAQGGGSRLHLIPNAIPLEPFMNADGNEIIKKYSLEDKRIAIFVGRLAPEKNLDFLLRATAHLISNLPDFQLLLVGDGPHRSALENLTRELRLERHVIFTGMVNPSFVPSYLAASQLFVMPSTSEVNPLALLEAMASGVPIVGINAPGAQDVVISGQNGILTNDNEIEFSQAIQTLLLNPLQQEKMGKQAKLKAEEFSAAAQAKKLEALYSRLTIQRQGPV